MNLLAMVMVAIWGMMMITALYLMNRGINHLSGGDGIKR